MVVFLQDSGYSEIHFLIQHVSLFVIIITCNDLTIKKQTHGASKT